MATTTLIPTLIPTRQAQLWTKKGLGRLGFLIRQARLDLGWSMDRLALAVFHKTGEQIAKKTVGNIENNVGFPQYNSLAAIAALKIVKSSTGRPLDHHDFIDIASENYELTPMDIKNMVGCAMLINKISEGEIWRKLETIRLNTGVSFSFTIDRFEKIKEGQIRPTPGDIGIIRELVDPNSEAFDETEWLQSANLL